jgi:aspartyl-tRNA(Asn)/glutamyl-tRNA(Gln) amidotransferase subunit A
MTAPITGSTASAAFDDALTRLRQKKLDYHTRRPPFDYDARPVVSNDASWNSPRTAMLREGRGPLVDAAFALRRGVMTSVRLVDESLAAARDRAELGGLVEECENAHREAQLRDDELAVGFDRGPLHGIPITVKDVIDVAGTMTRAGSDAYSEVPTTDAESVARLRAAGAVVIGKAATHEFALGVTTPQCRNPHDPTRIPGGSSGGSAVCVVTGAGLASLGTDTRASIRVPAALSGAVGFKPTYGLIPTDGVVALSWTMDHVAPLAMSVTDTALLLDAMVGGASALAWTPPSQLDHLRVGVPFAGFSDTEPGVVAAIDDALEQLAQLGCQISVAESPTDEDLDLAGAVGLIISRCEAACLHRAMALDRDIYWEEVRDQLAFAEPITAVDYLYAQRIRLELRDRLLREFDRCDVIAMPTTPVVAPPVADFARHLMSLARHAIPWSLVGFPALSIPVRTSEGLPVGLQLVAPPGGEALLIQVGGAVETMIRDGRSSAG